ncbi:MAG TPA: DNA repair nucleotidyltransferase [Myxococcales bacterium]|nr:DNA repair nucleotidyltransferase [Myxococcales bacterium]
MSESPSWACVCLPELALQVLVRAYPQLRQGPCAVIDEDRPQGRVLCVNQAARELRLLPGMTYAAGLSLAPDLRARVVPQQQLQQVVDGVCEVLHTLSPRVEPSQQEPGVFWLDVQGLQRVFPSLGVWIQSLHRQLRALELWPRVVVGWSRFGTYALARGGHAVGQILESQEHERQAYEDICLSRLGLTPSVRDALGKLGVRDVGALLSLPADGLRRRFGPEVLQLWRLGTGDWRPSLRAMAPQVPLCQQEILDNPVEHRSQVLFVIKRGLYGLLVRLASRHQALSSLGCKLQIEGGSLIEFEISPAQPTLDEHQVLELVRLKLESLSLKGAIEEVFIRVEPASAQREQLQLFKHRGKRDLSAAKEAIARLRAELGDDAVCRAHLTSGNLPEAQFTWVPTKQVSLPEPIPVDRRTLVRRISSRPLRLPPQSRHTRDEGLLVTGVEQGAVVRSWGPYIISGGWWVREVCREYQFTQVQSGRLLWLYYDRGRRRWYQQGRIC